MEINFFIIKFIHNSKFNLIYFFYLSFTIYEVMFPNKLPTTALIDVNGDTKIKDLTLNLEAR